MLALSTLNPPGATAKVNQQNENTAPPTIEERLDAITQALRHRENQLQDPSGTIPSPKFELEDGLDLAQFRNGGFRNNGRWRNGSGWYNGGRWRNGGWVNWRNGWRDGGGFLNFRDW